MSLSRRGLTIVPSLAALFIAMPIHAQDSLGAQTGEPPERIDLLVEVPESEPELENCSQDQDAATITGEIVVCRRSSGNEHRLYDDDTAKNRHAERTKGPMPLEVNLPNTIPAVGVTMSIKGCFIPPCPPPPALIIDVEALPEAPKGSDADRIARGLAPLGETDPLEISEEDLGLPPPLAESEVSPSVSASPAEEPSG